MKVKDVANIISAGVTTADFITNLAVTTIIKKQAKNNFRMAMATHLGLSALAVVVSGAQTARLIKAIRKEANEGSDPIANAMSLDGFFNTQTKQETKV